MLELASGAIWSVLDGSEYLSFFKPTVVEDGNDQDHERREIKLPDQRDQHEPELHIYPITTRACGFHGQTQQGSKKSIDKMVIRNQLTTIRIVIDTA